MKPEEVEHLIKGDKDRIWFETNADRRAFLRVLTRAIQPVSKETIDIEETDTGTCDLGAIEECLGSTWGDTKGNNAQFIIKKEEDTEKKTCYPCLKARIEHWIQEMEDTVKYHLEKYRVAEEL